MFLKVLYDSQEKNCVGISFLIKLHAYGKYIKRYKEQHKKLEIRLKMKSKKISGVPRLFVRKDQNILISY